MFSGCPPHLLYSLQISGADASPEMYFEKVPYEDLTGAPGQQAPGDDPPAAKAGDEEEGGSRSQA
jgi:hypothetical protein